MSKQSSPFYLYAMKGSLSFFCFPFSLIFFYSPICYPVSTLAPSTCSSPNLPCISQNSVLYSWNSSPCFYLPSSIQFKGPGPSQITSQHHCCTLFRLLFQLPMKYSTWISHRLLIFYMPETENIIFPKPAHFPLVPTSLNGTITYLLANLKS